MTKQEQAKEMLTLSRQQQRRIWIDNKKALGMGWQEFYRSLVITAKEKDEK